MTTDVGSLSKKLDDFMALVDGDPSITDDSPLREVCRDVEVLLSKGLSPEVVHLADGVFVYQGQEGIEKRIPLHRDYMEVAPDPDERFRSHWHLVDSLAVLGLNREAVEEQTKLYRWTCENLSDEHIVRTLEDTTQARCWLMEGRINEWFKLYEEASNRLESPDVSHYWRCNFLRAGAGVYALADYLDEALIELSKLDACIENKSQWEHFRVFWLAGVTSRLEIFRKKKEWDEFDLTAKEGVRHVEVEFAKLTAGNPTDVDKLAWVAHDLGCCMFWAGRYETAESLLQTAISAKDDAGHHFFLSACIWAARRDREKTLCHLRIAQSFIRNYQNRGRYYYYFLETPEFSDVWEDPKFLAALGH